MGCKVIYHRADRSPADELNNRQTTCAKAIEQLESPSQGSSFFNATITLDKSHEAFFSLVDRGAFRDVLKCGEEHSMDRRKFEQCTAPIERRLKEPRPSNIGHS